MSRIIVLVFACVVLAGVSGCVAPQIEVGRYAVDYNRAVATEANETMLLNIVRSRFRDPTHYTSTSAITAQLTAERSANIGASLAGSARSVSSTDQTASSASGATQTVTEAVSRGREVFGGSAGFSLKYGQEPTFSIQVNNTPEFTRGTSSPITASMFVNLLGQGYRSDLLLAVLVEAIVISDKDGKRTLLVSNPAANGKVTGQPCDAGLFRTFQATMRYRIGDAVRPPALTTLSATPEAIAGLGDLLSSGYALRPAAGVAGTGQPAQLELYRPIARQTSELIPYVKEPEDLARLLQLAGSCLPLSGSDGASQTQAESFASTTAALGDLKIGLSLRSVDGALYAMGEYLREFEDCFQHRSIDAPAHCANQVRIDNDALLQIERMPLDHDPGYSPAHTTYAGARWIVPRDANHRTMQVIDMLQKLMNLNRSVDELRTPTFIKVN